MERPSVSRAWLVVASAVALGIAGGYQFAWSSIRGPLGAQIGATETALGTVFTIFIVFQTASQFPAGWVRDRYGPRWPLVVGAVLLAAGYLGAAFARSIELVYLSYAVGGVGAGSAYTVAMNTPVKWFDERRGLATGIVGMSYGGASFLMIPVVRRGVDLDVDATLLGLAAFSGLAVLLAAAVIRDPPGMTVRGSEDGDAIGGNEGQDDGGPEDAAPTDGRVADRAYTWRETIRTWQFWLLYAVFLVVNCVGLMLIGTAVTFADQFGLAAAVATAGASAIAIFDAGGVLGGGWLSDRLGLKETVAGSLVLCGIALAGTIAAGMAGIGVLFVAMVGIAAFFRSPVFAVFPAMIGSYYGESHSSTNYALLYSSKIWGGVFGGTVSSGLVVSLGWVETFGLGAVMLVVAGLAMLLLRPVDATASGPGTAAPREA